MPRTFRHVSDRKNREILSVFPMLKSDCWDDSPTLTYRAVSMWDHWLYLSNEEHLLVPSSREEYLEWSDRFAKLDSQIASNTAIYLVSGRHWPRFKELCNADQLIYRLSPECPAGRWMLVLPELRLIYTSGDGDVHTRVTYYQDAMLARPFDVWVERAGLKYIEEYPRTN